MITWGKQYKVLHSTDIRKPCVLSTHTLLKTDETVRRSLHSTSSNAPQIPVFFSFSFSLKMSSSSSKFLIYFHQSFLFFTNAIVSLSQSLPTPLSLSFIHSFIKSMANHLLIFFYMIRVYFFGLFFVCILLNVFFFLVSLHA